MDWLELNPIENLWQKLKQIIMGMEAATNLNHLTKKISRARNILGRKKEFLSALNCSMPSRVEAVVDAEVDTTKSLAQNVKTSQCWQFIPVFVIYMQFIQRKFMLLSRGRIYLIALVNK